MVYIHSLLIIELLEIHASSYDLREKGTSHLTVFRAQRKAFSAQLGNQYHGRIKFGQITNTVKISTCEQQSQKYNIAYCIQN